MTKRRLPKGKFKVKIKPSMEGTLTAWCKRHGYGDSVTEKCILAAKKAGPRMKRKAIFAQNARRWKK